MDDDLNPYQPPSCEPKTEPIRRRRSALVAAVFFFVFFLVVFGVGAWMIYLAAFDTNTMQYMRSTAFTFGLLALGASVLPLWFAIALNRANRARNS